MAWHWAIGVERVDLVKKQGAMVREAGRYVRRADLVAHRVDWRRADRIIMYAWGKEFGFEGMLSKPIVRK